MDKRLMITPGRGPIWTTLNGLTDIYGSDDLASLVRGCLSCGPSTAGGCVRTCQGVRLAGRRLTSRCRLTV